MVRPTLDEYFLQMLLLVASRATCLRRKVACILVDQGGHVISTGYNGVPKHAQHCQEEHPCLGAQDQKGDSSRCLAIHAEQNAILQAGGRAMQAWTAYCSCTPCFTCAKLFCNMRLKRVVCLEEYADKTGVQLL